jgi:hypothetical protein
MKILPMGAELFYADERTDGQTGRHDEANSRFSQLCEKRLKSEEITAVLSRRSRNFPVNIVISTNYSVTLKSEFIQLLK